MAELAKKRFTVFDPIFKQEICVFLNCNEDDYLKWQKQVGVSNIEGLNSNFIAFSTHISCEDRPNVYVVWLNHFNWTLDNQESLIHEIIHTVIRIWEANNIQFVPDTQEFFAHSTGGLYSTIAAKIMIKGRKKK